MLRERGGMLVNFLRLCEIGDAEPNPNNNKGTTDK